MACQRALRDRFVERYATVAKPESARARFEDLVVAYEEAHRAYHTLAHIEACLADFDAMRGLAQDPAALELAIFYHDVVYDPRARDNEMRSARWAMRDLSSDGATPERCNVVVDLVVSTAEHSASLEGDAALLSDVDLAILGASQARFLAYEEEVRREYAFVADDDFAEGRAHFLIGMQKRAHLFHCQPMRGRYEEQARENLGRAIARWTQAAKG